MAIINEKSVNLLADDLYDELLGIANDMKSLDSESSKILQDNLFDLYIRNETSYAWIVEYCPCVYESAPQMLSIHKTAVGAFNKMRRFRDDKINDETWGTLPVLGYFLCAEVNGPKASIMKGHKNDWWVRIRKVEVEE